MGIPFREPGLFTGPDLRPDGALPELPDLGPVSHEAETLIASVGRYCLVHSDFNLKNLLVDPDTGRLTGVVDWEYAHAGCPLTDLGNLFRDDPDPVFAASVVRAVTRLAPPLPPDWLRIARAADLYALVDLARRGRVNPVVLRARELLEATTGTGDLAAGRPPSAGCAS